MHAWEQAGAISDHQQEVFLPCIELLNCCSEDALLWPQATKSNPSTENDVYRQASVHCVPLYCLKSRAGVHVNRVRGSLAFMWYPSRSTPAALPLYRTLSMGDCCGIKAVWVYQ